MKPNGRSNEVLRFIAEQCDTSEAYKVAKPKLYGAYCRWASARGLAPVSQVWFNNLLSANDINANAGNYINVRLKPAA